MYRVLPDRIRDPIKLSELLDAYLEMLAHSPLHVHLKALSYDTGIPESIYERLAGLHRRKVADAEITPTDFHVLFANIQFRFPTVQIYQCADDALFFVL